MNVHIEKKALSPPWMNKEYFQTFLRKQEKNISLVVTDVTFQEAVAKAENYLSSALRVKVYYTSDSNSEVIRSQSVFIKYYDLDSHFVKILSDAGMYKREHDIYDRVLPEINKLFHEPLQISPRAIVCDDTRCLVLQDLSEEGYKTVNRKEQLDLEHSIFALKLLSKFHAGSVALMRRQSNFADTYTQLYIVNKHKHYLDNHYARSIHHLSSAVSNWVGSEKYGEKIREFSNHVVDKLINFFAPREDKFQVLIHGDFWTNNILYKYDDVTHEIVDIKLIDFQLCSVGHPALDLQYFFFTSLRDDVRENHMDSLIQEYYTALRKELTMVGCDDAVYTIEQLKEDLDETVALGFIYASVSLPLVLADPEDTPDLFLAYEENSEDMLLTAEPTGSQFIAIYKKLLDYFVKKGVFG